MSNSVGLLLEGERTFGLMERDWIKGSKEEDLGLLKGEAPVETDKSKKEISKEKDSCRHLPLYIKHNNNHMKMINSPANTRQ